MHGIHETFIEVAIDKNCVFHRRLENLPISGAPVHEHAFRASSEVPLKTVEIVS